MFRCDRRPHDGHDGLRNRLPAVADIGAHVIGTGRAADRQKALDFGAHEFVDLDTDDLHDVGDVDLAFDVIAGDIQTRSAGLVKAGGMLVSVVGPVEAPW